MQIKIITIGKLKEKFLKEAVNEYLKRISIYAKVEIIELAEEKISDNPSQAEEFNVRQKEGERILKAIPNQAYVIVLAIQGKQLSSEELAEKISELALRGNSNLAIIIGGSIGLSDEVINKADFRLSFSKMTFPHQLMRVILIEQVYRAFKINRGEPYHK